MILYIYAYVTTLGAACNYIWCISTVTFLVPQRPVRIPTKTFPGRAISSVRRSCSQTYRLRRGSRCCLSTPISRRRLTRWTTVSSIQRVSHSSYAENSTSSSYLTPATNVFVSAVVSRPPLAHSAESHKGSFWTIIRTEESIYRFRKYYSSESSCPFFFFFFWFFFLSHASNFFFVHFSFNRQKFLNPYFFWK